MQVSSVYVSLITGIYVFAAVHQLAFYFQGTGRVIIIPAPGNYQSFATENSALAKLSRPPLPVYHQRSLLVSRGLSRHGDCGTTIPQMNGASKG